MDRKTRFSGEILAHDLRSATELVRVVVQAKAALIRALGVIDHHCLAEVSDNFVAIECLTTCIEIHLTALEERLEYHQEYVRRQVEETEHVLAGQGTQCVPSGATEAGSIQRNAR